jgi:hypothetical protein
VRSASPPAPGFLTEPTLLHTFHAPVEHFGTVAADAGMIFAANHFKHASLEPRQLLCTP